MPAEPRRIEKKVFSKNQKLSDSPNAFPCTSLGNTLEFHQNLKENSVALPVCFPHTTEGPALRVRIGREEGARLGNVNLCFPVSTLSASPGSKCPKCGIRRVRPRALPWSCPSSRPGLGLSCMCLRVLVRNGPHGPCGLHGLAFILQFPASCTLFFQQLPRLCRGWELRACGTGQHYFRDLPGTHISQGVLRFLWRLQHSPF